jgi:hypothetical protein
LRLKFFDQELGGVPLSVPDECLREGDARPLMRAGPSHQSLRFPRASRSCGRPGAIEIDQWISDVRPLEHSIGVVWFAEFEQPSTPDPFVFRCCEGELGREQSLEGIGIRVDLERAEQQPACPRDIACGLKRADEFGRRVRTGDIARVDLREELARLADTTLPKEQGRSHHQSFVRRKAPHGRSTIEFERSIGFSLGGCDATQRDQQCPGVRLVRRHSLVQDLGFVILSLTEQDVRQDAFRIGMRVEGGARALFGKREVAS